MAPLNAFTTVGQSPAQLGFVPKFRSHPIGTWSADGSGIVLSDVQQLSSIQQTIARISEGLAIVQSDRGIELFRAGQGSFGAAPDRVNCLPLLAYLPPLSLRNLGSSEFCDDYGIRVPYVTGSMANGIASVEIVQAIARAGMLGFFGAAGLSLAAIEVAIERLQTSLGDTPFGINLIHSPNEMGHERDTVELFLNRGIRLIEASAFLDLTLPVIRYRLAGIHRDSQGKIVTPNRILAKVSRIEVATKFLSPPPERFVRELLESRIITPEQAELAKQIPVAQDITVEADSGGHTDNRPAITLFPTIVALRDRMQPLYGSAFPLRIGLAGGIATPRSTSAAFAMGAAYVVTGSVNQACVESGSSDVVRAMLAQAEQADVIMAPAADMFEMGVKVQVLKRGSMFAMRGAKLYELYRTYPSIESIPESERLTLEKQLFRAPLEEIWQQTIAYFQQRDPAQVQRGLADPKHKMALVFRWYLGQSSRWANRGDATRKLDYQVWCGPAMGAFNEWAKGSFLEQPKQRDVVTVAWNLLFGAAIVARETQLRAAGLDLPAHYYPTHPQTLAELQPLVPEMSA
ncbi:PfaD family polyunsaturated fatty acid/polyketide biosynthesis protein [Tuwongella immobilis]|uniref:[Acyl-carrier-protein] S-malonyltransferase-like inserted helical domain-containing protein n=1 Tax=Tuwongella immobilis TaxID=692036 RepID=A0A6C2YPG9_9BACT|nr:PfaD family polyunsaturated fatty acid/polyketide biosynthesis protein [Tuwongella immobilis]VIP03201.1 2-nitropropane dioxygenase : 2-nitropropane dioxygenase, NPD OS=bacterium UASB270 GN=U27_00265 PE=4 SV=1: NMO [Tuwongella immobilis]VTS03690.1 2-nitropropane dioxygenase : 2-nitropropane dioxygenase, NPD OS=bacterium UASB270 GN=U27_00265 PE=4 SV=1: NMO [Tuwongella immobilis]